VASEASSVAPERVRRVALWWMTPLLFSMPIASMDLYSYAAQAQISRNGLDPYSFTPADLPGKFLDNVAGNWVDTPSPYGPLWVAVSRWIASVIGDHALITALILRLLPCIALVAIAHLLPAMAERFGGRGDIALWLAVANPLVLVHGVGGGHNDIVMMALGIAALSFASKPGAGMREFVLAVVLATLATAVKFPAIVLLGFVVPFFLYGRESRRFTEVLKLCLVALLVGLLTLGAVSWVADVGLGWTKQVNNAVRVVSFMSVPTMIGIVLRAVFGAEHGPLVDSTVRATRTAGSIVSALVLIALWWRATFLAISPARLLAWGLAVTVVLSPAVQPWYFIWALGIAALYVVRARQLSWLAALSVSLVLITTPMGSPVDLAPFIAAALVAGLGSRALLGPVVDRPLAVSRT
jgi:alpha-1,6-mannosyltransferase